MSKIKKLLAVIVIILITIDVTLTLLDKEVE